MPVSFNSPPRNFFLLGSGGEDAVTNFFHNINRSSSTDNRYFTGDIRYSESDQKFLLSGTGRNSNARPFGFFEKQSYDAETDPENPVNVEEWRTKVTESIDPGNTIGQAGATLNFMRQTSDYGGSIIVGGKSGFVPWIAKFTAQGAEVWSASSQSTDVEYFDVALNSNGDIFACGYKIETYTNPPEQGNIGFIEKWDEDGNPMWGMASTRIGGDVRLNAIAANDRDQVVGVGAIDGVECQGYVVKLDASNGELIWDLTINSGEEHQAGSKNPIELRDVYIDGKDQIYIVGSETIYDGGVINNGIIFKYTAEGNLIWQKRTAVGEEQCYYKVWSDTAVEQTVVISHEVVAGSPTKRGPSLIKYSKNGDIVFKRRIQSSTNFSDEPYGLEGDPSFYYILFVDEQENVGTGASKTYNFGKVSSSGNGFGEFTYDATNSKTITYSVNSAVDRIGRLSDGSVRNDTSDHISYPYNGLKTLFDDYATNITYKKTRHEEKDVFLYSGTSAYAFPPPLLGSNTTIPCSVSGSIVTITDAGHNLTTGMSVKIKLQLENPSIVIYNYNLTVSYTVTKVDNNTFTYDLGSNMHTGYTGRAFYYEPNIPIGGSASSPILRPVDFSELHLIGEVYSGSGDWIDQSGNGHDCTPQDGVSYVGAATSGDSGRYFDFDGSQDKIVGPDCSTIFDDVGSGSGGDATIEVWVEFDDVTTRQTIVSGYITDPNRWDFEVKDGVIRGGHHDNTWFTSTSSVNTGSWKHLMFVLNNATNTLKFYLNGKEDASVASSGFDFHVGVPFSLGDRTNSNIGTLNGRIGEVRVYKEALTPTQIFQNWNATKYKYKTQVPNIAARISSNLIIDSTLILHYDFGNKACYETAENLIPWSSDGGNWGEGTAGTLVRNAGIAPDGTNTATKASTTSTDIDISPHLGAAYPGATGQIAITGGNTYTLSIWAKASTPDQVGNDFKLRWKRVQGDNVFVSTTFALEKNWRRYSVTGTTFANNSTIGCWIGGVPGSEALVWGAQLEEGSILNNYIPTYGSPVAARTKPKNLCPDITSHSASDNGIVTGCAFTYVGGVPCFDFDGSGVNTSFIDTGVNAGSVSSLTVECWIKVDTYDNSGAGITIGDPSGSVTDQCYLGVGTSGGNSIDWRFYLDPYQEECEYFTSSNDWQHVVGVYDQDAGYGTMRLYINDVEQDTAINQNNTSPIDFSSYRNIMVGTNSNNSNIGNGDLDGQIAEVRVYKRRLSVGEISQNFNATRDKYGV